MPGYANDNAPYVIHFDEEKLVDFSYLQRREQPEPEMPFDFEPEPPPMAA